MFQSNRDRQIPGRPLPPGCSHDPFGCYTRADGRQGGDVSAGSAGREDGLSQVHLSLLAGRWGLLMHLEQVWNNILHDPFLIVICSFLALVFLWVLITPPILLWRLRHYPLEKAREMATGAKDGVIAIIGLCGANVLCGVILRQFIVQRYSADALAFGLLLVDFPLGYILLAVFARIWVAKRRVRQLEAQSQEESF
jgi:hypothetical protein